MKASSLRELPQRLQIGIPSVIFSLIRIWIRIRSFLSPGPSQFGCQYIMHDNLTRAWQFARARQLPELANP
jgi:hypothetical protein